jgi:hypothetical protein
VITVMPAALISPIAMPKTASRISSRLTITTV